MSDEEFERLIPADEPWTGAPMKMCARCYDEVDVFPATCAEKPELLKGAPIGMYHCPDCGTMVLAGVPHPYLCERCNTRAHPEFDLPREEKSIEVTPSCGCVGCDLELPVVEGMHGKGDKQFPCQLRTAHIEIIDEGNPEGTIAAGCSLSFCETGEVPK